MIIPQRGATVKYWTGTVTQRADYSDPGGDNGSDKNCLERKCRSFCLLRRSFQSLAPLGLRRNHVVNHNYLGKRKGGVSRDQPRVWNGSPPSLAPCDLSAPVKGRMTGRAAFEVGRQPSNLTPLVRQLRRQASGFSFSWAFGSLNGGDGNETAVKSKIEIPEPWEWLVKSRLWREG